MHRHGYQGRKFHRERDQRKALMKGLADSLILHESIETTLEKAKSLRPYAEKLVTKARKGGLHNRRQVIVGLSTLEAAHKLVDEIAPRLQRESGYLRIVKTTARRGDNAQLARISFVDDMSGEIKKPGTKVEKKAGTTSTTKTTKTTKTTIKAKPKAKNTPTKKKDKK